MRQIRSNMQTIGELIRIVFWSCTKFFYLNSSLVNHLNLKERRGHNEAVLKESLSEFSENQKERQSSVRPFKLRRLQIGPSIEKLCFLEYPQGSKLKLSGLQKPVKWILPLQMNIFKDGMKNLLNYRLPSSKLLESPFLKINSSCLELSHGYSSRYFMILSIVFRPGWMRFSWWALLEIRIT